MGKLLTLEQKAGTLLKLGDRFKVTLVDIVLYNIGNVIWVEAYHYFQAILLMIGGNFIHNLLQNLAVLGCTGMCCTEAHIKLVPFYQFLGPFLELVLFY